MRPQPPLLCTLAALLVLLSAATAEAQWPQFRGPNGTGVHTGGRLPVDLSPASASTWSAGVPFGRSSPIVFGDRIYLTASDGDRLLTLCLKRSDGSVLWQHALTRKRVDERVSAHNGPASPTPAADASGVYVFFPDFGLLALSTEGQERWRMPLGPFHVSYGMASSPVIADGLVLQICDQQSGSFLVAVDARSGDVRWRVDRQAVREGWYTPAVARTATGRAAIVLAGSSRIEGVDLATGETIWNFPASGAENLGVPVVNGDRVYVNIAGFTAPYVPTWEALLAEHDEDEDARVTRDELRDVPEFHEGFNYADVDRDGFISEAEWTEMRDVGVAAFGLTALQLDGDATPALAWRVERSLSYVPAPLLYGEVVYSVKSGGIITAVSATSGAMLKQARAKSALGAYYASPVAGDGKVYVSSEEGKVVVLRAGAELEVIAVHDFGEEIYATPALVDEEIFVRTRGHLYCFRSAPEP